MIFEQGYGEWLCNALDNRLQRVNDKLACKQYDEISRKALSFNTDEIAVTVQGGNAETSDVPGIDQNTAPLLVTFICRAVYKTTVRNAVTDVIKEYNAVPLEMHFYDAVNRKDVTTKVKSSFSTPMVLEERSWATERETITVTFIQMAVSVVYGENAFINPIPWKLKIDGKSYDINSILQYDLASRPSHDEYVTQGADRVVMTLMAKSNSFAFTIARSGDDDELQAIFEKELVSEIGLLADKAIVLSAYTVDIPISKYELVETYVNNAAAYVLSMGR